MGLHTAPPARFAPAGWLLVACYLWLAAWVAGCESLQRKFTRKPKHPSAAPAPIITFQDYSRTMTLLDRYRKHYLMFDYWDSELMAALQGSSLNPKRYRRASAESLSELQTMSGLLVGEAAGHLAPLIEERAAIDSQLQRAPLDGMRANAIWRTLEAQRRQIHREFFWRDAERQLKTADE